jgi:uncharacterized C2H2 Zn-finger protein
MLLCFRAVQKKQPLRSKGKSSGFTCKVCGEVFQNKTHLKRHFGSAHGRKRRTKQAMQEARAAEQSKGEICNFCTICCVVLLAIDNPANDVVL